MSGINTNIYGITTNEWKAFKKELKAIDKKDDSFKLKKSDYKEIKSRIDSGKLSEYLTNAGLDNKSFYAAMGLTLSGKVDGTQKAGDVHPAAEAAEVTAKDKKETEKAFRSREVETATPSYTEIAQMANAPTIEARYGNLLAALDKNPALGIYNNDNIQIDTSKFVPRQA